MMTSQYGSDVGPCGKCDDVVFRYIYTNTTKIVLRLSFLVRLDRFRML